MYTSPLPRNLDTIEETLLGVHAALEGLVRFGLRCCDEPSETLVYEIACLLRPQAAAVGACVATLGDMRVLGPELADDQPWPW